MIRVALGLVAVAALMLPVSAASAASQEAREADRLLTGVAGQVTHGWDQLPAEMMVARYHNGERLYVACGDVALLGKRILAEAGIHSRRVATLTKQPFNYFDDGHILLEVRIDGRWIVYDLDNNLQPLDQSGNGVRISDFVAMRKRRFRRLTDPATDPQYDLSRSSNPAYTQWVYADLNRWYDRVLGVPLIMHQGVYTFGDRQQRSRVLGYAPAHLFVGKKQWRAITGGSPDGVSKRKRAAERRRRPAGRQVGPRMAFTAL